MQVTQMNRKLAGGAGGLLIGVKNHSMPRKSSTFFRLRLSTNTQKNKAVTPLQISFNLFYVSLKEQRRMKRRGLNETFISPVP